MLIIENTENEIWYNFAASPSVCSCIDLIHVANGAWITAANCSDAHWLNCVAICKHKYWWGCSKSYLNQVRYCLSFFHGTLLWQTWTVSLKSGGVEPFWWLLLPEHEGWHERWNRFESFSKIVVFTVYIKTRSYAKRLISSCLQSYGSGCLHLYRSIDATLHMVFSSERQKHPPQKWK